MEANFTKFKNSKFTILYEGRTIRINIFPNDRKMDVENELNL